MKAHENPFRSERIERLPYRSPGFSWSGLEKKLAVLGGRGAVVGPEGHGKTTLLLEWMARRQAHGERPVGLRFHHGQRRLTAEQTQSLTGARTVFADSAEQLGWLGWREFLRLTRQAETVVVSTHRPGRLPVVHACQTSPELLDELVRELGETRCHLHALWLRHRGNIRNALLELYDACSRPG